MSVTDQRRTEASLAELVDRLKGHQKSSKGAPAYSRFVNRPLGRVIAAVAYRCGLTPNQVTAISAAFSALGIAVVLIAPVAPVSGLAAALLLAVGYAFDSADGQLARLRGGGSPAGEWLDHVVDCVKISALHLAVVVGLYRATDASPLAAVGMVFTVVANLYFFSFVLTDLLTRSQRGTTPSAAPAQARASVLRSLVVVPTDYGLLCVAFLLWGWIPAFLVLYVVLLVGTAGYVALGLPKWFRDMTALGSPR